MVAVPVRPATGFAGPVAPAARIDLLDALRAVALLGIFLVNIEWFSRPWQEFGTGIAPDAAGSALVVGWLLQVLVAGKFWILFSLLFGMGFWLMLDRAPDGRIDARYLRRLGLLLAFGLAHAVLLWVGDILHAYALAGLALLMLRGLSPGSRAALGFGVYGAVCGLLLLGAGLLSLAPVAVEPAVDPAAAQAAAQAYAHGGFAQVTAQRLDDFGNLLPNNLILLPLALSVFVVGGWLLPRLRDVAANRGFFIALACIGLPLGLGLSVWSARVAVRFPSGGADPREMFAMALHSMGALPLTLGYLALIALAWQGAGRRLLAWIAPAGRMALSNYLGQSLLASLLFYGYGLALWGRIPAAGQMLLVLVVFVLQVVASRWWLGRFQFGPAEWVLRSVTYLRPAAA